MNKCIFHGRLVRDPDLRYTNNGTAVCNMTIAVEDGYGDNKNVEYIKIVAWKKKGKAAAKYLKKGRQVIIEGKLTIRKNKKKGRTYYNPEIIANNIKYIYSSKKSNDNEEETKVEETTDEDTPDDIPEEDDFEVPF